MNWINFWISASSPKLHRSVVLALGAASLTVIIPDVAQSKAQGIGPMPFISCKIEKKPIASGLELTGVLWSDVPAAGNYNFTVDKVGASGRSKVLQSGIFSIEKNETVVVGTVTLNESRGDRYLARLVISRDGEELCSATL